MAVIVSSGLVSITATGAGDGGAVANAITAFTMPVGTPGVGGQALRKKLVIRRIRWRNRTGVNANLLIGFGDRTVAGSLFRQVFPSILMINGIDDGIDDLPLLGNSREGFLLDTTVPTGTTGDILVETDSALVAVAPGDVQVNMEVEVI